MPEQEEMACGYNQSSACGMIVLCVAEQEGLPTTCYSALKLRVSGVALACNQS